MKKTIISLLCLGVSSAAMAQYSQEEEKILTNKWFNHLDVGITAGTGGFGFDFATPMSQWARLRIGAEFRPSKKYKATFGMEVAEGADEATKRMRFNRLADELEKFTGTRPTNTVQMTGNMNMNHFKMLVDIYPFKNNRHWHATVGFYYGDNSLIEAKNTAESMNTLTAVGMYNKMYRRTLNNENPINIDAIGGTGIQMDEYIQKLRKWGSKHNDAKGNAIIESKVINYQYDVVDPFTGTVTKQDASVELKYGQFAEHGISIPIGTYTHDVIAQQDIYYDYSEKLYQEAKNYAGLDQGATIDFSQDEYHYQKDANGRYIKKGSIRYKKGEVMHRAGEMFYMVPDADNIIKATAVSNKFKPYVGIGYETTLRKDKRVSIGIDAGIMVWGGNPTVDVLNPEGLDAFGNTLYMTYDMTRDFNNFKSHTVEDYVNSVKHYPIFPQISARFSYRIF